MAKPLAHRELRRLLRQAGYRYLRRGKHAVWTNDTGHTVSVPHRPQVEIKPNVVAQVLRRIGVPGD